MGEIQLSKHTLKSNSKGLFIFFSSLTLTCATKAAKQMARVLLNIKDNY